MSGTGVMRLTCVNVEAIYCKNYSTTAYTSLACSALFKFTP